MPAELRARFGWAAERICGAAGGEPVRAGQLALRTMNFGQPWRTEGIEEVDCTVLVPLALLAEEMEREYADFVEDCEAHPSDDPYEAAQRERGWPSVPRMLRDPELLRMSAGWYGTELLRRWLGDGGPAEKPGFVINTAVFRDREGELLRFAGRARRAGQPVRCQDA